LEEVFDETILFTGNHEDRFSRTNKFHIDNTRVLQMLGRDMKHYKFSEYHYLILDDWRLTHPGSYRQQKLSVASALADKFRMNVLQAHGHFGSIGYSRSGYLVGDMGGIFDKTRAEYTMEKDTTHPVWNNGFFIYKDKVMRPVLEGWDLA